MKKMLYIFSFLILVGFPALAQDDAAGIRIRDKMTEYIGQKLGPVDIVVLSATPDQPHKPIEEYDWDFYQSMVDFSFSAPAFSRRSQSRTSL